MEWSKRADQPSNGGMTVWSGRGVQGKLQAESYFVPGVYTVESASPLEADCSWALHVVAARRAQACTKDGKKAASDRVQARQVRRTPWLNTRRDMP